MGANVKNITFFLLLLAAPLSSMASSYYIVYDLPEGSFKSDPVQKQKDAWTAFFESLGKTPPADWSSGFDIGRSGTSCCGTSFADLPTEKYPATEIHGSVDIGFQSNVSDISALSDVTLIDGTLRLHNMDNPSLLPLSNTVIKNETSDVKVYESGLTSLKGLENVSNVKYLDVNDNNLNTLEGLNGLESAARIKAQSNQLTDISALSNLKRMAPKPFINLGGNPDLQDLSPLNNMTQFAGGAGNNCYSTGYPCATLRVENRPYATKLAANSVICEEIAIGKAVVKDGDTIVDPVNVCEM